MSREDADTPFDNFRLAKTLQGVDVGRPVLENLIFRNRCKRGGHADGRCLRLDPHANPDGGLTTPKRAKPPLWTHGAKPVRNLRCGLAARNPRETRLWTHVSEACETLL